MELASTRRNFKRQLKTKKPSSRILLFVYLQLTNIITGPDLVLKFLGFKYGDVAEIGLGWFTTSVNFIFVLLSALVLLNNKKASLQLVTKAKKIIIILVLTFFSSVLVLDNMFSQSINLIFLTIGYFIKVCSLIVLFDKYNIEFSATLLKVLKILMILMLLYLVIFFANGFSTTLIGRYQSIFNQPNTLGQFSSLTIVALFSDRLYFSTRCKRANNNLSFFFFLSIGIVFVFMSQSFTNLLLITLILLIYFFYSLSNRILQVLLLISIILFSFFFFTNSKDLSVLSFSNVNVSASNFKRDLTLTGRTQIWRDVLDKVQLENKTLCGYGIGGFWGKTGAPSSKIDNALFAEIGQSHNGLIDLYVQYGLIGVSLFICFLSSILNKLSKMKSNSSYVIFFNFFFVLFLFNNLVESSYLQPKNFLNIIFFLIIVSILNSVPSQGFVQSGLKKNIN
ncbi:O-antigen ligase family protein [Flavobacterium sp. CFBP9031]|uniref:O-antigen ligase family protein n=1 Tax=Flavobacterium sp. CFBP9031 TaxID=3096538 RepID=UPI002A6B7F7D|nr:O-antigen ligase family protein [Flavobacterium sp. CFBP9031]MDY0986384.1 O-antigen ligase family protein [Flavobacterium sp. CFBP9031]